MTTVNTHEAKTQLSRLLALVAKGEEVIIARNGKPIARLTRIEEPRPRRVFGSTRGQIKLLPGWDDPMTDEELAEWYDSPIVPRKDAGGRPRNEEGVP